MAKANELSGSDPPNGDTLSRGMCENCNPITESDRLTVKPSHPTKEKSLVQPRFARRYLFFFCSSSDYFHNRYLFRKPYFCFILSYKLSSR